MLTQQGIAKHLDLSQAAVSTLMVELGIDWKAASLNEIRVAYIRRLREQAAGRAAVGDLDLAGERAALAKAQRERIEMQNAVTRGELAPVVLIEEKNLPHKELDYAARKLLEGLGFREVAASGRDVVFA